MSSIADAPRVTVGGGEARKARSIALPIFALVLASVVSATAILFFVTFNGPPPMEPPRPLQTIVAALTGQPQLTRADRLDDIHGPPGGNGIVDRVLGDDRRTRAARAAQPLPVTRDATPPEPRFRENPDPLTRARIAALLGVPEGDVVALTQITPRRAGRELFGSFSIGWRTAQGWRVVRSPAPPRFTRWHLNTLLAMAVAVLALSVPAWMLARTISRPLAQLADAADRAGTGAPLPALPGGSREVRELAQAVSTMHARLARHAESRTAMLGAIAHDLGTPLSRLSFWIEQLPDPARDRAVGDIDEMRAMIADTLRFARDEAGARDATRVELSSLLDSLCEDMRVGGAAVAVLAGPRAVVRGDPGGLRRVFANLVGNALRYGDHATVAWVVTGGRVIVTIADRGPGIDPATVERLFEPFVRGDPSRNRATGGSGLGLAIVRSIAARHGGTATLANLPDGSGAVATITLPLDSRGA